MNDQYADVRRSFPDFDEFTEGMSATEREATAAIMRGTFRYALDQFNDARADFVQAWVDTLRDAALRAQGVIPGGKDER